MIGSGSVYNGESVRSTIRRLYGTLPEAALTLAHATVPPITAELIKSHARVFDAVFGALREQLQAEQQQSTAAATAAVASSWLLSVPTSLRSCEEDVVNYLGMLVAIDFCHWAEVRRSPEHSAASPSATAASAAIVKQAREEGGIEAAPGEEVTGFAGFYTVVVEPEASTVATDTAASSSAEQTESAEKLLTEPKASTLSTSSGAKAKDVTLLRGSAAMMWLLRRAVEEHHTPWYDVDYLLQFRGDVDAALRALRACFMGCEADGVTPLWMPCARTRVQLLLSLADTFQQKRTSFYRLLCDCGGFMFRPPADTEAAQNGVRGFVPSLVLLHPRYNDFTCLRSGGVDSDPVLPILKLSQLTALALEQALPPFWCSRRINETSTSPVSTSPAAWIAQRAAAIAEALASPPSPSSAADLSSSAAAGLFTDRAELSICCDYQIPKTLRAAGLITYDAHLAQLVDHHVLLRPGCAEEASIRIAALVAADRLLDYVNSPAGAAVMSQGNATGTTLVPRSCTVNHLDHALWFVGRYMVSSEARHHLCRTIMY